MSACVTAGEDIDVAAAEQSIVAPMGTPPAEIIDLERTNIIHNFALGFRVRDNLVVGPYLTPISTNDVLEYRLSPASSLKRFLHDASGRPYVSTAGTLPGLAVYNLDEPAGTANRIDTRSTATLTGETLECWGFRPTTPNHWERRSVRVTVTGGTADELATSPVTSTQFLETSDVGVPCITTTSPRLLSGIVKTVDAATHAATLYRGGAIAYWFDGLAGLAGLRQDTRTEGPYIIWTNPAAVSGPPKMCMDIPFANPHTQTWIQQYPCHNGDNQLYYVDHRSLTGAQPRLVSALSGRCLDIEWGDAVIGRHLQEYDCHDGNNQKFNLHSRSNAQIAPMSASLCVAVHGGPTTSPANLEQATCIGTSFAVQELWTLEAKPLPPI